MPPHVPVDFVVLPPEHGRSVTDFWGWDAHEAQLCCPHGMSGDIGRCSARRALKHKFYKPTKTMVTAGILPFRENCHGRTGNRNRDVMISSQRLWPLDHEAGLLNVSVRIFYPFICGFVFVEGLYSVLVSVTNCARFLCGVKVGYCLWKLRLRSCG